MDLLGRLSNPPETLEPFADQGVERSHEPYEKPWKQAICSPAAPETDLQQSPGRLSNPALTTNTPPPQLPRQVQRRLTPSDVDGICASYINGSTITEQAGSYGVNRMTIMRHLQDEGVPRRRVARKMTDGLVAEAAAMYLDGHSLATVANKYKVNTRTLGREFRKAGVPIRPRRGWTY